LPSPAGGRARSDSTIPPGKLAQTERALPSPLAGEGSSAFQQSNPGEGLLGRPFQ
jgi:hypothetical protein